MPPEHASSRPGNRCERFEVPDWYRDAKLGIFIHWGAASVPAFQSEWYPKWMYQRGSEVFEHHAAVHGDQKDFGYKDFIPGFTMERWSPDAWAELFAASGARYVVPVAEHHDGLAHYDWPHSRWTTVHRGSGRDLIAELGEAVRKTDLRYGLSSHRAYHWRFYAHDDAFDTADPEFEDLYGRPHAPDEPADEAFLDDWLARCNFLVDTYQPDLVWFDWCIGWPEFESRRRAFAAAYYNAADAWGREVVINYKEEDFAPGTGVFDIERGQLDEIREDFWQTDTSISRNGWAYNTDPDNKSATSLLHDLLDVVSKNGCLLLNIGPRPDGTITEEQEAVLRAMGAWLAINGDAVYGTRPWKVFGEGPTRVKAGTFQEKENTGFTPEDFRFTATPDGDTLFVTTLGVPDSATDTVLVRSLSSSVKLLLGDVIGVDLLGQDEPLTFERGPDGLLIHLPDLSAAQHGVAFRIRTRPADAPKRTADAVGSHTPDIDAAG